MIYLRQNSYYLSNFCLYTLGYCCIFWCRSCIRMGLSLFLGYVLDLVEPNYFCPKNNNLTAIFVCVYSGQSTHPILPQQVEMEIISPLNHFFSNFRPKKRNIYVISMLLSYFSCNFFFFIFSLRMQAPIFVLI